jgi:hypothetical protein
MQKGGRADGYKPIGSRVRERFQKHRVHHAEHGGVCADSEREGHDRHRGEAAIFSEQAQRKLCVFE